MKNIEQIIKQTNSTMSMEGMSLQTEDINRIRNSIGNQKSVEKTIQSLVKKHKVMG